ncbi:DivIVA domain-containing protein [Streptomyces sp. NPDC005548]|uniref:DivIVA domain-containing protein n=1 Tax=Streptomyces sp. NPDC005548 TaxID=3364724 RepID=UPI0036772657
MTYAPGIETDPSPDSAARRNGDLPQGLKSSPYDPTIPNPNYPHLGFNPVPGSTDTVRALHKKLGNCAKVLEETHGLVTKLMEGSYWKGDAAVAFREQLDGGPLPLNLKNAAHSVRKAARQLDRWESELDDFQRRAKRLEEDAKEAQAAVDSAQGRASKAGGDADLHKKGSRGDSAQKALTHANSAVDDAKDELEQIRGKARKLAEEHEDKARLRANKIRDATKKLAPHEPGFLDEALDWITDNLPDILSWTAALIGIVALFVVTGGMAAAVLLMVAATMSAGAVAARLSDPVVWESLKDGFTKGELDADFWSNLIGVTADGLGALPGIGAVGKGAFGAWHAAGEAGEVLTAGQRLATFGSKTMGAAREMADLKNPFTEWAVAKAPRLTRTVEVAEKAAPWAGLVTASYGLSASLVDSLDNDTVANVGTAVDGTFLGPIDGAETVDLIRRFFR